MHRRTVLELFAGLAAAGVPSLGAQAPRRVVVAGGGIIGANIACQLVTRGADVTLVERARPGAGATADSFAWINAKKRPLDYFNLSRMGLQAWHQLDREFSGTLPLAWGGSVEWHADDTRGAALRAQIRDFRQWGYGVRAINAAGLRALEPRLVPGPLASAAHWEDEAHIDPVGVTEMLVKRAQTNGARVEYPAEVTGLDLAGGRLRAVRTSKGDLAADVLVAACGTDTPRVAALAGVRVPLRDAPGVLVHVPPGPRLIDRVALAPPGNIKQKPDGRIVTGSDFASGGGDTSREAGERHLQRMAAVLPELGKAAVEKMTQGFRPMPADGFPIVGFAPGRSDVYIAVMHSGVTLGPLVGRLAATEILDRVPLAALAAYRLERFKG
ncbi:MAG: FAD-binding oxidoreductase [Acidobacteria bacterium]|nr:FAD-binding oxidoreductase [Acidobacteriota bacterium]